MKQRTTNDPTDHQYQIEDQMKGKKPTKYHNRKTEYQGVQFASQKEAKRYQELLWMEQAELICKIELQPRYDIIVNDQKVCTYVGDFRYKDVATDTIILEDVKSPITKTPLYRLKKKLVKALYGVEIIEV